MRKDKSQTILHELWTIKAILKNNGKRTFIYHGSEARYFIKKRGKYKIPLSLLIIKGLMSCFRLGFLAPTLAYRDRHSFRNEVAILIKFKDRRILVPDVIYVGDDFMALEVIDGENVDILMADKHHSASIWHVAISGIAQVHRKGLCLSQAFARNIMLQREDVYFIDFEEDPLANMQLFQAQSRDWVYFLLSTLWRFKSFDHLISTWQIQICSEAQDVQKTLLVIARRMDWLRFLPKSRKLWGRDIIQLQAIGQFFFEWQQSIESPTQSL